MDKLLKYLDKQIILPIYNPPKGFEDFFIKEQKIQNLLGV